ncbi:MAG: hypothetical protein ISR42_09410 [Acidimicrobiia bacterium]|nr:hypothetical protein [Actinomycetota bacterium]MBL6925585.1 hypothetical protein [Acidimicrobiia bacterium]
MRLFLAVVPPTELINRLTGLPRPEAPGLRWTAPHQWHVTLRFLGRTDPAVVIGALARLSTPSAVAEVGPATAVLGNRVVMVPVAGLDEVAAAVTALTAEVGSRRVVGRSWDTSPWPGPEARYRPDRPALPSRHRSKLTRSAWYAARPSPKEPATRSWSGSP